MGDCCQGSAALDLDYKVKIELDGTCSCSKSSTLSFRRNQAQAVPLSDQHGMAEVIVLSNYQDSQTSADKVTNKAAGAMTTAFRHTITPTITCEDLLLRMRKYLQRNNFEQVPQLSSSQFVQLDSVFASYQVRKRGKTGFAATWSSRARTPIAAAPMSPRSTSYLAQSAASVPGDAGIDSRLGRLEEEIARLNWNHQRGASPMMGRNLSSPMAGAAQPSPMLMSGQLPHRSADLSQSYPQSPQRSPQQLSHPYQQSPRQQGGALMSPRHLGF